MNNTTIIRATPSRRGVPPRPYHRRPKLAVLCAALRESLLHRPGMDSVVELLPAPITARFQQTMEELLTLPTAALGGLPPACRTTETTLLTRAGAALAAAILRPSEAATHAAELALRQVHQRLRDAGPSAALGLTLVNHLRLHLADTPQARGRLAGELTAWGEQALAQWRLWSDQRFGAIHCVDWAPEQRYCKALGYRFEGREYPIRYVFERVEHQQREWEVLCRDVLVPVLRSVQVWRSLAEAPAGLRLSA